MKKGGMRVLGLMMGFLFILCGIGWSAQVRITNKNIEQPRKDRFISCCSGESSYTKA